MRKRALLALITVVVVITVAGVGGLVLTEWMDDGPTRATPAPSSPAPRELIVEGEVDGSPEETGDDYLEAWARGDYETMRELVDEAPPDFAAQHQAFEDAVAAPSVRFTSGEVEKTGEETAEMPFTAERDVSGHKGPWKIESRLRFAVRDLTWKVLWTPAVMQPDLEEGGSLVRVTADTAGPRFVTREGKTFPQNSEAEPYLTNLAARMPEPTSGTPVSWRLEADNPGKPPVELLRYDPEPSKGKIKTTIEWFPQAAAARALDDVQQPAAIVVVRPSSGEVIAVADRLGGQGAFTRKYPPGSTFKTVTAAALLAGGLSPDEQVACPASYTIPNGRRIDNYQDRDHGTLSLREAFALSCNTTFARLAVERLSGDALLDQATAFGFGVRLATGVGGTCGSMAPPENSDALAEDSFGQGTVEASPLCMALVAAAVESGTWRPPHIVPSGTGFDDGDQPQSVTLPEAVASGLRTMMDAVTLDGTAAGTDLPAGVSGKTGTAEDWQGGADHAWFIGYQGDLAFAVFVEHGGTGRNAAVPLAARFLRAI